MRAMERIALGARSTDPMTATDGGAIDPRESRLWAYAVSQGASRDDAADIVQEAFVRLAVARAADVSIDNVDGWLFTTVHHLVVDLARKRNIWQLTVARLVSLRESRTAVDPPEASSDEVWSAVDALAQRQRAAIYLRYRADLDFATIAVILGISESAARSYVTKGLKQLEVRLGTRRNEL